MRTHTAHTGARERTHAYLSMKTNENPVAGWYQLSPMFALQFILVLTVHVTSKTTAIHWLWLHNAGLFNMGGWRRIIQCCGSKADGLLLFYL